MDKINMIFWFSLVFIGVILNVVPGLVNMGEVPGLFLIGFGLIFLTHLLRKKAA